GIYSDAAVPDAAVACAHATFPARPSESADAGTAQGQETVIAAMSSIDIGLNRDGGPYGYDLDHTCTCPGPPSCRQQPGSQIICDDDAGRDNTSITLFALMGGTASTGTEQVNQGLQSGQFSMLIAVRGYNGMPDDPQVNVSIYVSNGLNDVEDGGTQKPQGNGNDRWTVDPGSLTNGAQLLGKSCDNDNQPNNLVCQPVVIDDNAYVSNYVLVAEPGQPFPVVFGDRSFLGGARMILSGGILVGHLKEVPLSGGGTSFEITDGTLAGRWRTADLLSTLAAIPDVNDNDPRYPYLCGAAPAYAIIKPFVCGSSDITSNSATDNMGAPCDAISVGLTFSATPAHLGDVYGIAPAPAGCATSTGPFTDSCSN
ncbi:MAG: hypothetical protein ACREJ3_00595, partial [Polyangiaceae bacterium]